MKLMKIKHPKMLHLPWSGLVTEDDRKLKTDAVFHKQEVIVTEKIDGENITLAKDYWHPRSLHKKQHWSRDYVQGLHGRIGYQIPEGYRICGENCYATHTIQYDRLPHYFLVHSIWRQRVCLSWDDSLLLAESLGLTMVPLLYRGLYDLEAIQSAVCAMRLRSICATGPGTQEGYVIRLARSFNLSHFAESVGKYVNPAFRQAFDEAEDHWSAGHLQRNTLTDPL
jgi:hypothetical protein